MRSMRALSRVLVAGVIAVLMSASVHGWGMDVHRWLTRQALDGLPQEIRPFFAQKRDFIVEHSADPDLWRVVGLRGDLGAEDPNHFLDIDGFGEPAPFKNVPREWPAVVAKYGEAKANQNGRLPWRTEEIYTRLVTTFQDIAKGTGPSYSADNARYLVAVLSHYVEDAHVPFHAVVSYDGQATNQRGIHSRFESELVLRNQAALHLAPVAIKPVPNVRDFIFDTLIESESLVSSVLAADRAAAAGRDLYDDGYFAAFFKGAQPVVEKRLSDAVSGVASVVVSAWDKAGRPKLPLDAPRPPVRIR